MEFLELYESCVEKDIEEKIRVEPEDLKNDPIMKTKTDFQKRYMCEFGNLQSQKERTSTSSAQLLLNFQGRKGIVKFSKISESLVLRNRADIQRKKKGKGKIDDDQYIETKCIRLFPRPSNLQEL